MSGRLFGMVIVGVAGVLVGGCTRTFHGSVAQPNPLVRPTETLRDSEKVVIVTGDMELKKPRPALAGQQASIMRNERYPLRNEASFTMVSRDRLRFHVQLEHKWQDWADLTTWDVYLEDNLGHHYAPEATEHAKTRHVVEMWDQEIRTVNRNEFGDIVAINDDGWKRRQPLGSLSVFRGRADFVFYKRDIFTPQMEWLRLVVRRSGQAFEFTWKFTDTRNVARRD